MLKPEQPADAQKTEPSKRFPKKEAWALVDWMNEQMHGKTTTEWTCGNEHDDMEDAVGFLHMLIWSLCGEDESTRGECDDEEKDYDE